MIHIHRDLLLGTLPFPAHWPLRFFLSFLLILGPLNHSVSLNLSTSSWPSTGRSRFSSSFSMIFQLPTVRALSTGVTRLGWTCTLGSLASSPCCWTAS